MKNCPTDKGTADEVAANISLWSYHASSVDAFKAVGVQALHYYCTVPRPNWFWQGKGGEVFDPETKSAKNILISQVLRNQIHAMVTTTFLDKHVDQSAGREHTGVTLSLQHNKLEVQCLQTIL